jgi:manganese transport protein
LAGGALGQWDGAGWYGSAARVLMPVPGEGLRGARRRLLFLGLAFVAAVAYVDAGNVGTNVTAGARFGYLLLWVVVLANLTAVLVQYRAAKVTIATGRRT